MGTFPPGKFSTAERGEAGPEFETKLGFSATPRTNFHSHTVHGQ